MEKRVEFSSTLVSNKKRPLQLVGSSLLKVGSSNSDQSQEITNDCEKLTKQTTSAETIKHENDNIKQKRIKLEERTEINVPLLLRSNDHLKNNMKLAVSAIDSFKADVNSRPEEPDFSSGKFSIEDFAENLKKTFEKKKDVDKQDDSIFELKLRPDRLGLGALQTQEKIEARQDFQNNTDNGKAEITKNSNSDKRLMLLKNLKLKPMIIINGRFRGQIGIALDLIETDEDIFDSLALDPGENKEAFLPKIQIPLRDIQPLPREEISKNVEARNLIRSVKKELAEEKIAQTSEVTKANSHKNVVNIRADNWVVERLIVRIISSKLMDGKLFKMKGIVTSVDEGKQTCSIKMSSTGRVIYNIENGDIQTVIPKKAMLAPGANPKGCKPDILVVLGKHRGKPGIFLRRSDIGVVILLDSAGSPNFETISEVELNAGDVCQFVNS